MNLLATGINGSIGRNLQTAIPVNIRLEMDRQQIFRNLTALAQNATLLHLAGSTNILEIEKNPGNHYSTEVLGSLRLFEAFKEAGGSRFIYVSSGHIFAGQEGVEPYSITSEPKPISTYGKHKFITETLLTERSLQCEVELTIVRVFSVFGMGMAAHYLAGRIEREIRTQSYTPTRNGDDIRDFSTPKEVATDLETITRLKRAPGLIHCCSGSAKSVRNIIIETFNEYPLEMITSGVSETPRLVGERTSDLGPRQFK